MTAHTDAHHNQSSKRGCWHQTFNLRSISFCSPALLRRKAKNNTPSTHPVSSTSTKWRSRCLEELVTRYEVFYIRVNHLNMFRVNSHKNLLPTVYCSRKKSVGQFSTLHRCISVTSIRTVISAREARKCYSELKYWL